LYFQCIAWGAAIEAPFLAGLVSEEGYLNLTALLLMWFHMPGFVLAYPLTAPLHHRISTVAENRIGYASLFFFQAILIGTVIYGLKYKEVLPSTSDLDG